MGINIKNPKTEQLIRELSRLTGEGSTEAITVAVRERIERLGESARRERKRKAILAIVERAAPLMKDFDMDEAMYGENGLYDRETGLPK